MVARLVIDALWRNRWIYLVVGVFLLPFWLLFGVSRSGPLPISITALSLILAALLGPMFVIATMGLRELRHLPTTEGDLWRATWVAATVVSAGVLLATKAISVLLVAASGGSPKVSAETMLLSALYDFTWAGVLLPMILLLGYAGPAVARSGALAGSPPAGSLVVMLACFGLPILVSGALPARVGEFTPATTGVLFACLAIAFGALAWTPERGALAGEGAQAQRAVVLRGAAPKRQRRRADSLTGISRVAVPHLLATLALVVAACLALAAYGELFGSGPWWFVPQARDLFDPADVGDHGLTFFVLVPCFAVTMQGFWAPWARLLKVLPLSAGQINALLLLTPVATWAMLWLVGLSLYSLAHGTPPTLRVDLAFGLAGIAAIAHAVLLRFQGSTAVGWIAAFFAGLWPPLMKVGLSDGTFAHVVFAVIGAIALCAAGFINHRTLTRSTSWSKAYRLPAKVFKMRLRSSY